MRGKLNDVQARRARHGLIPAHAGKTLCAEPRGRESRAHPRACGENLLQSVRRGNGEWLIPAHAGKTIHHDVIALPRQAHPRACGENPLQRQRLLQVVGSSPRMRGKRAKADPGDVATGLIPAHAGKTEYRERRGRRPRAHPRACGENEDW